MALDVTTAADLFGLGKAVCLTNGILEARVLVGRGPRVLYFGLVGGRNVLWVDDRTEGDFIPGLNNLFGRGDRYNILGGHRLWTSPEHPLRSYYPDFDPVEHTVLPRCCRFTPPPQLENGVRHAVELEMSEKSNAMTVRVSVTNISDTPLTLAPWAITQLAPGGFELIPQPKRPTGLLPDRLFVAWPYTDMGDPRLTMGGDLITLRCDTAVEKPFKLGMSGVSSALYVLDDLVFVKRVQPVQDGRYPDFGCSFETYVNGRFLEMETLGQTADLMPGQTAEHSETWELYVLDGACTPRVIWERYGEQP